MSIEDDDWAKYELCTCNHELGHHIHANERSKGEYATIFLTVDPCTRCGCTFFQPVNSDNKQLRAVVKDLRKPLVELD